MQFIETTNEQGQPHFIRKFDSYGDLIEFCKSPVGHDGHRSSTDRTDGKWAGTRTLSEAYALAETGYNEIRETVEMQARDIATQVREVAELTYQPQWDVSGGAVDIGRYVMGEPECMIDYTFTEVPKQGQTVTIACNAMMSSGVTSKQIKEYGATLAALIQVLADCNRNVEVWAEYSIGSRSGMTYSVVVCVKPLDDPIDLGKLLYGFAHPSMARRLLFCVAEHESAAMRVRHGIGSGYGGDNGQWGFVVRENTNADLVLNQRTDRELAGLGSKKWILAKLTQLGIEVG